MKTNMKGDDAKPWKCPGGEHVMGQVVRNGSGVRQLLLYREAVDPTAEEIQDVDVVAVVQGLVLDVRCSICGDMRTWAPGEEALRRLLESRKMKD